MHPDEDSVGQRKVRASEYIDDPAEPLDNLPLGPPGRQGHRGDGDGRDRDGLNRHDRHQDLFPDRPAHGTSRTRTAVNVRRLIPISGQSLAAVYAGQGNGTETRWVGPR